MNRRVQTKHRFGDKDYALVPDRIKEFRQDSPRGDIQTQDTFNLDGSVTFRATIIQDRANEYSARATGSARYTEVELKKPKAFEKLETISVGRALANLGYLNDGQVATTEEMQEFEQYRMDKVEEAMKAIETAEKRGDFESILGNLSPEQQRDVAPFVKKRMEALRETKELANA